VSEVDTRSLAQEAGVVDQASHASAAAGAYAHEMAMRNEVP
jgi:hypothetical protein